MKNLTYWIGVCRMGFIYTFETRPHYMGDTGRYLEYRSNKWHKGETYTGDTSNKEPGQLYEVTGDVEELVHTQGLDCMIEG